jgi:hypothetical protein
MEGKGRDIILALYRNSFEGDEEKEIERSQ